MTRDILGPCLVLDTVAASHIHLAALFAAPAGHIPPPVVTAGGTVAPAPLARVGDTDILRARFALPLGDAPCYSWNGRTFQLAGLTGDLRIAYVSCNGQEHGDLDRPPGERNAMWARLLARHEEQPFALLLHGGDQIYADEATHGHPLSEDWPRSIPRDPSRAGLDDLRAHLRQRFAARYLAILSDPHVSALCARVPSLAQWDDHDICDGWGSLRRSRTYSPVGQVIFEVAREMALLFQHAAVDGDLPARFADPRGLHLGWRVAAPGLDLLAPDLRSERTRRQVMGAGGWAMMEAAARAPATERTLLLSSVPLLGPRLSLLESLMLVIPRMQKYEDDLRDQWQSRAHREEWRRMLTTVLDMVKRGPVTVLSGEIHLAGRATMEGEARRTLHQLVASGIAHPAPPRAWARILGALASLGESPLPGRAITFRRIPGQSQRYIADRNFLVLARKSGAWSARWEFETRGLSPPLDL